MSMKFLLVLAVLVVAFWIWRNNRITDTPAERPVRRERDRPVPMIACDHCGTHLPEGEAVKGTDGRYCCQEHRRQHEPHSR